MVDELVRRCQAGEENAINELFRLHGTMIHNISFRMTRNPEWQLDIFQEVVRKVIDNIGSFKGESKFTTWLYRITVNEALRFVQKERMCKNQVSLDETAPSHASKEEGALSVIERKELFTHIMNALSKLPEEYRKTLSLFYFADRTIEEIAEVMGKSKGAIKAILWKGRRAIVKKVKPRLGP